MENVKFSIIAQNKTEKAFKAIKASAGGLSKTFVGLGAAAAGVMGVGALGSMAKTAMDTGDKIHKLTIRLGASAEALSQYRHVATMSGVSFETLTMGWQRMTRRVAESAAGTGKARKAFQELGIDVAALVKMQPAQQFETIAEALSKVADPADKVRLAMQIFGSEGVSLLQTMEGGAAGLQAMRQEADALGMTMTQDMVTAMANTNDAIAKVGSQVTSLVETMMADLAPVILEVTDDIKEWFMANRDIVTQDMKEVIKGLIVTFKTLLPVVTVIVDTFNAVGKAIGWAAWQVYSFIEASKSLISSSSLMKEAIGGFTFGLTDSLFDDGTAAAGTGTGTGNATVVNNFNTQISRSDANAIANESARQAGRQ